MFKSKSVIMALFAMTGALALPGAYAAGTASGTPVNNRATVDYDVGAVAQTPIESAPGGNSTPGAGNGADTSFLVDTVVDFTVVEVGGGATAVNPGQVNAVTQFTVANTGNATQDFSLSAVDIAGGSITLGATTINDTIDTNSLLVFVDNGNGVYEPGVDTATFVDELPSDSDPLAVNTATVFVVATIPLAAVDSDAANVTMSATAGDAGAPGVEGALTTESAGPDVANVVQVVFGNASGANAAGNAEESDDDSYLVISAQLNVEKTSQVVSDPINGAVDPMAIPGALMEYTITIQNTGSADAVNVAVTDDIPATLQFEPAQYNGNSADVEYTVGTGAPVYCIADAGDFNNDGCGLSGTVLEVGLPAAPINVGTTPADDAVVVKFTVSIN